MSAQPLRLGFIGFGEAARRFARDLAAAGVSEIVAFSPSAASAAADDPLRTQATEAGVELVGSARAVCERSTLIVALTPGAQALPALRRVRRYLREGQIYADASTSSVKDMERAAALVHGAGFVDAAVMDPVPMNGIKVLTVASGSHAQAFHDLLAPYGMNIQVVSDRAGAASAMKLMRSVVMKGAAALLLESLEAAQRYGITDALVADIARFIDGQPFEQIIRRWVCGTAIHATRRVHETTEAIALLRSLDSTTRMTRATRAVLEEIVAMGLRERFGAREPETIEPVLDALIELRPARAARSTPKAAS